MYNYKAICCRNIPELFLDKLVARQHFSQFGQITRFVLQPRRMTCTVGFETEAEAERARSEGDVFKGHKFEIDYAEHETNISAQNTEDWINPEVQTELDALWRTESKKSFNSQNIAKFLGISSAKPTPRPIPTPPVTTFGSQASAAVAAATGIKVSPNKIDQETSGQELKAIMRKPAYTAEEKYRALDARDKLLRIINARKPKLVKAIATKGTCPDMCPEKERFMREFQRQVSSFEQLEGCEQVICHKRAIKEYSRSSADQEAPLQHDLRTEAALHMTMSYLMHKIIDLCDDPDVSIGDWFHFVWDRTRSIRKDITQQELCSLGAVKLIEQCARFHIHCAARLVAEEPSVFDSKINAENLTKCLQTLKYMYHDLRLKNITCASEPEFRSYIVLLNLRDANFLWDIQQLPINIQSSEQIRRAIAFYNALQDNNFVRFFDMMRQPETTYMSACVLLGYCYRLRVRAMQVLIKAHKWPKKDAFLPLSLIAKSLGFMDKTTAKEFLEAHGLQCDENRVLIDRMDMPDGGYKMEREEYLVESKRTVRVGECVCGENLPSPHIFDSHIPKDSFDENGMLKPEAWNAKDQWKTDFTEQNDSKENNIFEDVTAQRETLKSSDLQVQKPTAKLPHDNIFKIPQAAAPLGPTRQQSQSPKAQLFSNTSIFGFDKSTTPTAFNVNTPQSTMNFTDILGNTQTKSSFFQPIGMTSEPTKSLFGASPNTSQSSIFETKPLEQRDVMSNAEMKAKAERDAQELEQQRAEEAARQRAEEAARQRAEEEAQKRAEEEAAAKAREQEKIAAERAKQTRLKAEKERRRHLKAKRKAAIEATAQELYSTLLNNYINEEITVAVDEALEEMEATERFYQQLSHRMFNETLDDLIMRDALKIRVNFHYEQHLLKRCFTAWVAFIRKQRDERKRFETTSFWSTESRQQQAADVAMPNHEDTIAMIRRYRQGEACDFSKLMERSQTAGSKTKPKLDLWRLLQATVPTKSVGATRYVKLLFTLPNDNEELLGFKSKCEYWMNRYLLKGHHQPHERPPEGAFINEISHNVALCVRKVCGVCPLNESGERAAKELEHSDGIVCFMTPQQLPTTRNRLLNVRKSSNRIAIILFNGESINEHQLAQHLDIHNMNFESYRIFGCLVSKSRFNFTKMLHDAVKFLAMQIKMMYDNNNESLQQQALIPFITVHLGEELWQSWKFSAINNPYFFCALRDAQLLHGLYNESVTRLQRIATERFQNVKLFPYDLRCHVPNVSLDVPRDLEHFVPGWHTEAYRRRLNDFFECIKLPELPIFPDPSMDLDNVDKFEQSLYLWLLNYGVVCLPDNEELSVTSSFTAMREFVMQMNRPELGLLTLAEKLQTINYWSILKSFAITRLDSLLGKECPPAVVYCCKQLESFENTPWWLNYKPVTEISFDSTNIVESISEEEATNRQRMSEKEDQDALDILQKETDSLINRVKKRKACAPCNFSELTDAIDKRIKLTELRELEFAKENIFKSSDMEFDSDSNENATSSPTKDSPSESMNNTSYDIKNMESINSESIENVLKSASNLLKRINGK